MTFPLSQLIHTMGFVGCQISRELITGQPLEREREIEREGERERESLPHMLLCGRRAQSKGQ